jgi:uncharacterized membrane protein YiaA
MKALKLFAIFALVAVIVTGCTWYEISVWNECRQTNSFLYCMRVLGR